MTDRKIPVHTVFTSIYFLLALVTLMPTGTASKTCLLGYNALCSFSPISTIILLALGGLHIFLQKRSAVKKTA
jgi:hypothetical protein